MTTRKASARKIAEVIPLLLAASMTATSTWAASTLYVKPGGTGTGSGWSDASDLEAAVAAATAAGGECHIYLAKGVYYPAATVKLANGISLYGSFPGLSDAETLDARSIENTPSIISGDVNRNDYWEMYDANEGTITAQPSSYVISGGALNAPSDLAELCGDGPPRNPTKPLNVRQAVGDTGFNASHNKKCT